MPNRTPLTEIEKGIVVKLASASFPPGTASKRFAGNLADGYVKELSDKGRKFLAYVVHRFRRQYHLSQEEIAWVNEWINKEIPMPEHYTKSTVQASNWCSKCNRKTPWRVADGRRQWCIPCYDRDHQPKPIYLKLESEPVQMSFRDVVPDIEVK